MTQERRRGPAQGPNTDTTTATAALVMVTPRGDVLSPRRRCRRCHVPAGPLLLCGRHRLPREPLDLADVAFGDPIDWHAIGMDSGVPERDLLGRELAGVAV